MLRILAVLAALLIAAPAATAARAQTSDPVQAARIDDLAVLLRIDPLLEVLQKEGIDYADQLAQDMFGGKAVAGWHQSVTLIYDTRMMRARFDAGFNDALAQDAGLPAMLDFFDSDLGQRLIGLELAAREAMLDDLVEAMAGQAYGAMLAEKSPRLAALRDFATANDLIETNVMGALNANLAFYRGMAEGGGLQGEMTEDQMLADVWAQEDAVRQETEDWLYPFLALAYQPLTDAELAQYQAFSETAPGKAVNAALFVAFDAIFVAISHDLGLAVARQMQGEDL